MSSSGDEPSDPSGLRRFIFGDCDLTEWPPDDAHTGEPWSSFVAARSALQRDDRAEAERLWRAITEMPGLESRHVLQAWHFLRSMGVPPPEALSKRVLGAIAEVAVPHGHDLLAAYADGSVRYLNISGAASIVDAPIASVADAAHALLAVAEQIVTAIGPWEGPLPPLPPGHARLTMLTPSGPHFGQGPDAALRADPSAGAFLDAATNLLVAVVDRTAK